MLGIYIRLIRTQLPDHNSVYVAITMRKEGNQMKSAAQAYTHHLRSLADRRNARDT